MVDPGQLVSDIVQTVGFFLIPAILWLFLYWLAWEREPLATRIGFGRGTFWLLVLGGFVGSLADLPFLPWNGDVLAINLGGGLIPIVLSIALLLGPLEVPRGWVTGLVGLFALESVALLVLVILFPPTILWVLVKVVIAAVPATYLLLRSGSDVSSRKVLGRRAGLFLALTSAVTILTFLTTETVPGLGIESAFPEYLVAPIVVGFLAALLMRSGFEWPVERAMPVSYAAGTFGVLIGADLLRQPGLYSGNPAEIFAIGGAGPLDLLYLSGLLSLVAAYAGYRLLEPLRTADVTVLESVEEPPAVLLRKAWRLGSEGKMAESIRVSAEAARSAGLETRLLQGVPPTRSIEEDPWEGIRVPPWIVTDSRNLNALARNAPEETQEALRAFQTSRWLVRAGLDAGRPRFAGWAPRAWAFVLDLIFLTLPAIALFAILVYLSPGGSNAVLTGVPLNAAAIAYTGYAFVYFVVAESLYGHTVGKRLVGLSVLNRRLDRIGGIPAIVRNVPKLIPLTAIGIGLAVIIALLVKDVDVLSNAGTYSLFGLAGFAAAILAGFVVLVVLVAGAVSVFVIVRSVESQRLGDYLAGTWVVRDRPMA